MADHENSLDFKHTKAAYQLSHRDCVHYSTYVRVNTLCNVAKVDRFVFSEVFFDLLSRLYAKQVR